MLTNLFKELLLRGELNWEQDNIKVVLCKDINNPVYLKDISSDSRIITKEVNGRFVVGNSLKISEIEFSSINSLAKFCVLYKEIDDPSEGVVLFYDMISVQEESISIKWENDDFITI